MKQRLTHLLNTLLKPVRAQVVSTLEYTTLHHQRLALLAEAASAHRATLAKSGATGIVFSFNRPVQLFATLESYFMHAKNPAPLVVQYRATLPEADKIYSEIQKKLKAQPITWVKETTCRQTLLEILNGLKTPKLFFLVDDDVFIRPFDMKPFVALNPLEVVPSLRLHPGLSYCYTMKTACTPPATLKPSTTVPGMLTWAWGDAPLDWNYPFSVEGHLFDTAEIVMMTRASIFKAPNTYEGILHGFTPLVKNRPGLCYSTPKLFNNPCNKVQTENDNHAGVGISLTPEYFIERWHAGEKIDISKLEDIRTITIHQEVPFQFTKR